FHRDALLLDPSVVTEIEDALAVDVAELHHVIVADAFKVMAENLAGIDLIESRGIAPGEIGLTFAIVKGRAVRSDCHDDVVRAIVEMLCELDGRDDVSQSGNADIIELTHEIRVDLPPSAEIAAAAFGAE